MYCALTDAQKPIATNKVAIVWQNRFILTPFKVDANRFDQMLKYIKRTFVLHHKIPRHSIIRNMKEEFCAGQKKIQ